MVREKRVAESGRIEVEKALQAGFYNELTEGYDYFEPNDIPTAAELSNKGYDLKTKDIVIIAEDGEEYDSIIQHMHSLGISLKSEERSADHDKIKGKIEVETDIKLDKTIMRGLCKIAFNYFAFIAGRSLALNQSFDPIREFIRFGEGTADDFLGINLPPILYDDQILDKLGLKVTEGHLIIIGWNDKRIVSKLSLFNTLTYGIEFCSNFNGIWIPINSGHLFDLKGKGVSKLLHLSKYMSL